MRAVILALLTAAAVAGAATGVAGQTAPPMGTAAAGSLLAEGWEPLAFLLGHWVGTGGGAPGASTGAATFEPRAAGHAIVRQSYLNSATVHHEDVMLIYRDPAGVFRAVYADNEGHVIEYSVTTTDAPKGAVFVSDAAPGEPRFRLTYQMTSDTTLVNSFDAAAPGSAEFKPHVQGVLTRARR